jgi:hypothetical protein
MAKGEKTKEQVMVLKTLHRKLKIEQHEPHKQPGVSSGITISENCLLS